MYVCVSYRIRQKLFLNFSWTIVSTLAMAIGTGWKDTALSHHENHYCQTASMNCHNSITDKVPLVLLLEMYFKVKTQDVIKKCQDNTGSFIKTKQDAWRTKFAPKFITNLKLSSSWSWYQTDRLFTYTDATLIVYNFRAAYCLRLSLCAMIEV